MRLRPAPATGSGPPEGVGTRSGQVRVITPEVRVLRRVVDIWRYRELLTGLIRKELAVKYNSSVLGMLWSMLNPAFTLGIYYFVFQVVLGSGISAFAIFLMSGLLAWNFYSYAIMNATATMVGNAGIVKKVAFPREILPLASVGAGLVFFAFQSVVLIIVLVASRYVPAWSYLPLVIPALVATIVLASALAVFLSAVNVYLRDTQHLAELIVGALWFWATPIVYSYSQIAHKLTPGSLRPGAAALANAQTLPTAGEWWYLWHVLVVLGVGLVLLYGALTVFGRLEGNFAEEL